MATWIRSKHPGVYYREHQTRKNGPHLDRYLSIRYTAGNKRHHEGLGWVSEGWTLDKAATLLGQIKQNLRTGDGPTSLEDLRDDKRHIQKTKSAEAAQRRITFGQVAKRYLGWAQGSKDSWKDDEGRYNTHLAAHLGSLRLSEISTDTLVQYKRKLDETVSQRTKRKLAPATVIQCLALVRQIFNYAKETALDPSDPKRPIYEGPNPAKLTRRKGYGVRIPVLDNARLRTLTPAEFEVLRSAAEKYPEHHDIIMIAYDCGLRRSELLALKAEHVMGKGESLHVVDTKGGDNRIVYPKLSRKILLTRAEAATKEEPLLFPGRDGVRDADAFTTTFAKIADYSGLNDKITDPRFKVTPHTMRHTHATMLYMETHDLYLVLRRLGHADFSTTKKYIHLAEDLAARMGITDQPKRRP